MIYCIKRDISNFINKKIINIIILVATIIISLYYNNIHDKNLYINIVLNNTNEINNFLYIIYKLIYIGYLMYITYYIYTYDIKNNPEFIFLRISKKKRAFTKYISLLLINIIIHITNTIICVLFTKELNLYIITSILSAMLYHITIQSIFCTLLNYIKQYSILLTLIIYIIPIILSITISNKIYIICIEFIIILISYIINKNKILKLIEKESNV